MTRNIMAEGGVGSSEGTAGSAQSGLLSRRGFLKVSGAALALSLVHLEFRPLGAAADNDEPFPGLSEYSDFGDVYRQQWTWDRVARSTHNVNCAFQKSCAWNVYVKDGMVWREEQVGDYPRTNDSVPDFNPRGCQKGACYTARSVAPSRLLHPLKRVGPRGKGRWKRVSWEQALREIADATIDAIVEDGPGSVIWDMGSAITNGCYGLGLTRTVGMLDTPMIEANTEIGDHYPGATVTTGKICFLGSADDLLYSDLILIWGGNPVYTQIPNAHFILEARYHGARVVTIAPDYNASAIHADEWVPVNIGTDAALGLSMAQVMVEEDLFDRRFVDVGDFEVRVKISPTVRPGQVIVYHAWEPYQFRKGRSHQVLIPSAMNPIHLAGGYFQLQPSLLMGSPGCPDRGTRVEIERIAN